MALNLVTFDSIQHSEFNIPTKHIVQFDVASSRSAELFRDLL